MTCGIASFVITILYVHIIIAPDSFKGSLTAVEAAHAIRDGIASVLGDKSTFELVPLADGGEGTLDAVLSSGGERFTEEVRGPLVRSVQADWGILPNGTAIIEMAQAAGLTLIPEGFSYPMRAHTFGVGQLIKIALDRGCRDLLIGIGGSATTDGGVACLSALGARFLDARKKPILTGGGALIGLRSVDLENLDPRLQECHIKVLCDVTNPLHGPQGAAAIYAPQKGASVMKVNVLDRGLKQLAIVTQRTLGKDFRNVPGAGAAGGLGFGLMAYLGAQLVPGIRTILDVVHFREKLEKADLVITGEGSLDAQTLHGKTIAGITEMAAQVDVPVIAFGGRVRLDESQINQLGLHAAHAISDESAPLKESLRQAKVLLEQAAQKAAQDIA